MALISIPHWENETIYYINTNFHFLIVVLAWLNYRQSKVNRDIILILSVWFTPYVVLAIFYIFSVGKLDPMTTYIYYHSLYIYLTSYQLFITLYIFILSLYPYKSNKNYLRWSVILTIAVTSINYAPIFITGEYLENFEPLFVRSYHMHLINFSLLVVFWHQYTQTKLIFTEYLSNILSVYTVIIGLAILHAFSYQNDLLFTYMGQYFNAILFFIIIILWIARLNYVNKRESTENENYIENYYILQGFIDKPRKGMLVNFYSSINKTAVTITIIVMLFLGIYLFSFDKFEIFIKLNILLLILATIVSAILAIVTWHKRWYDAMGFFFKKQKLYKSGK